MKIYKTEDEMMDDVVNGTLSVEDSVTFEFNMSKRINITARDINAKIITAGNINAWNINAKIITAGNITAWDINAGGITAWNITAGGITAWNINAENITAGDITARDINAENISYYALCLSYKSIKCTSWKKRYSKGKDPICLEGELIIKPKDNKVKITCEGKEVEISRESAKALNLI